MIRAAAGRRVIDRLRPLGQEGGQILPLMLFLFVAIIAGGLVLFWLGVSTSQASGAQTAADAAALAGENTLVHEIDFSSDLSVSNGPCIPAVDAAAEHFASRNQAQVTSCQQVTSDASVGYDVEVIVRNNGTLPASSPDAGGAATAQARASSDPAAQASPTIETDESCVGGTVTEGTPFSPHGGTIGFFAATGTNYSHGCESRLAGALDELATAQHLHVSGVSGYVATGASTSTGAGSGTGTSSDSAAVGVASLHACGAISTTQGLGSVSDPVLARYDLVRPFATEPGEIQLTNQGCESTDSTQTQTVGSGNLNVHLVPFQNGGPQGSFVSVIGPGGSSSIGESELQVGCGIYHEWQSLNIGQNADEALRIALLTAADESDFGQNIGPNRSDPDASIGVFQQISDMGWGTIPQELDVSTSTALFFEGGTSPNGQSAGGLLKNLDSDPDLPLYELAQDTQGSGAGSSSDGLDNYGQYFPEEEQMYNQVTSGACKNVS